MPVVVVVVGVVVGIEDTRVGSKGLVRESRSRGQGGQKQCQQHSAQVPSEVEVDTVPGSK